MDENGFITEWNREAEITFGWARDEAMGQLLPDTVMPEDRRERFWSDVREFLSTGDGPFLGRRLELVGLHRDGHEFPVEITISAVRNGPGCAFHAFLHDISDRRSAVDQLAMGRELALGIANSETVEDGLALALEKIGTWGGWTLGEAWVVSADASVIEHSGAWFASSSDIEPFERATKACPLPAGTGLPGRAWRTRRPIWIRDVRSEPSFLRAELATEFGLGAGLAVPVLAGHAVVAVLLLFRSDVRDEDKLFVEAVGAVAAQLGSLIVRKRAEQGLRESEARYRLLADHATDMIVVTDPAGVILYVSPSCEAVSGYSPQEMIGRSGFEFMHPDDAGLVRDCFEALSRGEDQVTTPPHRGRRKDGTYRWWESTVVAIRDPVTGRMVEAQAAARDITERKLIEEELERSNLALERFACDVSHDLGEPLHLMSHASQRLAREYGGGLDEDGRKLLVATVDGLDRMKALISDLLEYSRVSFEPLERSPVDCSLVLGDALAVLEESIAERHAQVTFDRLPIVEAHPTQLTQVFQNLLCNALKFSRAGIPPRIHVGAAKEDGAWRFSVVDNGIGIDPTQAPRAFEMFGRLNPRDAYAGTGIGLSICRRVVEHHGGQIWVEPAEGGGSEFHFTLPAAQPA